MADPYFKLPKTIAQAEMRAVNRSAVIEYLRLSKSASRTELAQQLKISKPTVMRIIDRLMEAGFVHSTGDKERGRGRYRELLALNTADNLVIGVDIGGGHISGGLVNIGGQVLYDVHSEVVWTAPEQVFEFLVNTIQNITAQPRGQETNLLGIAIGVPGIVERRSGLVRLAPSLDWTNFPLLDELNKIFTLPVFIENDVNLAVLGEHWFGAGIGVDDLIMIAIGTGIGAGIILDGKLLRGYRESSGEIGYFVPGLDFLDNKYPGFGALELVASGKAIADRGRQRFEQLHPQDPHRKIDAADVFQAARENESWALGIVSEVIDYLSLAIANVSVCFDPELIILGGGVSNASDLLIEPIKDRISGVIPRLPRIEQSKLKESAVILGAVVRTFQKITGYSVFHRG